MKKVLLALLLVLFIPGVGFSTAKVVDLDQYIEDHLAWFSQSSFILTSKSGKILYIDPVKVPATFSKADVILITHEHYDHFNVETISRLKKTDTTVIVPENMAKTGWKALRIGESLQIGPFKITGIPAYNIGKVYHPQERGWLGYEIEVDGVKIYHAGDTDLIPEMQKINVDIALIPIGGTYTMNVKEAVKASQIIKAKIFIPMHFGSIIGDRQDGLRFASLVKPAKVKVLDAVNEN